MGMKDKRYMFDTSEAFQQQNCSFVWIAAGPRPLHDPECRRVAPVAAASGRNDGFSVTEKGYPAHVVEYDV